MRVIAGKYKKKQINAAKGMTSRPTTDKIKENIFNILGPLEGRGLDLFAGSGGLGIEAVSRGIDHMIFIDGSYDAVKAIKSNLLNIDETTEVYRNDAFRALKALSKRDIQFDIIFLDPPYHKGLIDKAIEKINEYHLLSSSGVILCECGKDENFNSSPYIVTKEEIYGTIKITVLKRSNDDH